MLSSFQELGLFIPNRDLQWIVDHGVFSRVTVMRFVGQGYSQRSSRGEKMHTHRNLVLTHYPRERWIVSGSIDDEKPIDLRADILDRFCPKVPIEMKFYVETIECKHNEETFLFKTLRIPPVVNLIRNQAINAGSTRPSFVLDLHNPTSPLKPEEATYKMEDLMEIAKIFPYSLVRQCRVWQKSEFKLDGQCEVIFAPTGQVIDRI